MKNKSREKTREKQQQKGDGTGAVEKGEEQEGTEGMITRGPVKDHKEEYHRSDEEKKRRA